MKKKKMEVWKITFRDGTSQQANNYFHLWHGEHEYIIKERIITNKETIEGKLWWKKTIVKPEEELRAILVIPIDNIWKNLYIQTEKFKMNKQIFQNPKE